MAAGDGKYPISSRWISATTSTLRQKLTFGDLDTAEATVFTDWYLGASGAVTLTPARYDNTNTFYSATVTAGTVTLTPALFVNGNTFYSATVTQGGATQTLTPALFTNSNTFYSATVTAGTVTLTPLLFTNSNTFFSAIITAGTVTLTPALFVNGNTFYSATVTQGGAAQTLTPSLFINSNTFFVAQIVNQYPNPSDVREGVVYGPGGIYTGTLVAGAGETSVAIRSFTRKF